MKVYQDITLLPQPEIPCHFLWEKLFQQIHLALATNKIIRAHIKDDVGYSEYGVSFPQYDVRLNALGAKLRVFAKTKEKMEQFDLSHWLDKLQDYFRWTSIENVPEKVEHARFKRRCFENNPEKLARRRIKRLEKNKEKNNGKQETFEQALSYYSGFSEEKTQLPFIYMYSETWKRRFPIFIERELLAQPVEGDFSCYELSNTATVPWF